MNNQRLSVVKLSVNEEGVVYDVDAGVDDPYSISLTLLSKPKVREDIERNGIGAIITTKRTFMQVQRVHKELHTYMIYLPEESPYFNLVVLIKAMAIIYNENIWPIILSNGAKLYDIIKSQDI